MKLLNLCCGNCRPQGEEWINCDDLHATLLPGTPERENLDKEANYVNADVVKDGAPFVNRMFDGIIMSHCLEHWDCQNGVKVMKHMHTLLKPGGALLVSVPDASYFRQVHAEDTVENAQRLFGEPIHLPDGETTFFGYGLWNRWHKAILTEDALWAYFVRAGFVSRGGIRRVEARRDMIPCIDPAIGEAGVRMSQLLNRLPFSLVMAGVKEDSP